MDNIPEDIVLDDLDALPYDNDVPYEEQLPSHPEPISLADRIGRNKVYLLSETSLSRVGKRKRSEEATQMKAEDEVEEMDGDTSHRNNAILLAGSPISHLPTDRLFAYAKHFNATPMGLEWVDDTTCVLVFPAKSEAQTAFSLLQKTLDETPDEEGFSTAKSIPMTFWPPEERISASLGKGEGLKGTIRMRWARNEDTKKKGARLQSQFYKKHGVDAGKEVVGPRSLVAAIEEGDYEGRYSSKRRRRDDEPIKAQLDDDIETFLREDSPEEEPPLSPPSKMRSDYIGSDGRTLLERTSMIRAHPETLASRIMIELPRRAQGRDRDRDTSEGGRAPRAGRDGRRRTADREGPTRRRRGGGREGRERTEPREKKSQQELDDELEAFLNERD